VLLNVASRSGSRRQRPDIAAFQIGTPSTPIFVAGRLAEEHDMSVVPHPDDPGTEIAVGHPGYGTRLFYPVQRRNPEVEHAVNRSTEGNPGAVRADPHDASLGISKNQAAGE